MSMVSSLRDRRGESVTREYGRQSSLSTTQPVGYLCCDCRVLMIEGVRRYGQRPWWNLFVASSYLGVALVLYATNLYALRTENQLPVWVLVGQSMVLFAAQLFRHKAPIPALAIASCIMVYDFTYDLPLPVMIVFIDLLFCATLGASKRAAQVILGVMIALAVGISLVDGIASADWRRAFFTTVNLFTLLVVPIWWSFNIRQHEELLQAERKQSRQLRQIAELDRRTAVNAERSRMARDLHDVVAGHLSAIAIQSEALLTMVDDEKERKLVRTVLESVRQNSLQSLAEMRSMIDILRADGGTADPRTAPARLAELDKLLDSARAGGLSLDVHKSFDELPVAVDLAAYRIIQEALTNALKHAGGGGARVDVQVAGEELIIEVLNEMTGPPGKGTGTGLVNMRERAHAVGGDFQAGPWQGGWRVRAVLPMGGVAS
ncbi:sensor histidine kinase [Kibdelosporangium philippinense]